MHNSDHVIVDVEAPIFKHKDDKDAKGIAQLTHAINPDAVGALKHLGADIIVCHHPHVPMNYEMFGEKILFYSLGNFIYDTDYQRAQINTDIGVVLKIYVFPDKYKDYTEKDWKDDFLNPNRLYRLENELQDLRLIYEIALQEENKAWQDSKLDKVINYLLSLSCPSFFLYP